MSTKKNEQSISDWYGKHYSFFCNKDCEYFPCHPVSDPEEFNCLFCFCPLYVLGRNCGGNFTYLENGFKDCSSCLLPHRRESYGYILKRYGDIVAAMAALEPKTQE